MEETLLNLFDSAPFLVSLLAGILTFVSPCVLPLIPAYLSYISGISVKELQHDEELTAKQHMRIIFASLMFILGFSLIFILLGASMAELVKDFFNYPWVTWVAGGIIVLFGLQTMGALNLSFLNLSKQSHFGSTKGLFAPFILGVSFALGWTPCIGPIFAAIVSMAAQGAASGLALMITYSFGLAIPFFLAALFTTKAIGFFSKIKQHFKVIEIVAGALLIIIGITIASGGMGRLTALFF